jgi:hypothetical protein
MATAQLNANVRVSSAPCCKIDTQLSWVSRRHIFSRFPHRCYYCLLFYPAFTFQTLLPHLYMCADVHIPLQVGSLPPHLHYQHLSSNPLQILLQGRVFPLPSSLEISHILAAMNFMCDSSALLQVGPYYYSLCKIMSRTVSIPRTSILMWMAMFKRVLVDTHLLLLPKRRKIVSLGVCFRISWNLKRKYL